MEMEVFNDFTGGWNDTVSPDNMKDSELKIAENISLSSRGGFKKRSGTSKISSSTTSYAAEVTFEYEWIFSDGTFKHIAIIDNDLCEISDTTGAATIKLAALSAEIIGYVVYRDKLYFVDGDEYYVWGWYKFEASDGSQTVTTDDIVKNTPASTGGGIEDHFYKALSALGTIDLSTEDYSNTSNWEDVTDGLIPDDIRAVVPASDSDNYLDPIRRCKYLFYHTASYRLFACGDSGDPTALYFSDTSALNYFPATNVMYPVTEQGKITGIVGLIKSILISYETGWRYWSGTDLSSAEWKPLPIPVGCMSHYSIAGVPYGIAFLSSEGICRVSASILNFETAVVVLNESVFDIITDGRIEDEIDGISNKENTRGVYFNGKYYLSYNESSVLVCDWNISGKPIVKYTGWDVNYWCPRLNGKLYFASLNYILITGQGYNDIDTSTGSSKAIIMTVKTKPYCLGDYDYSFNLKTSTRFFVQAQQESLTASSITSITLIADYGSTDFATTEVDLEESFIWGEAWGAKWGASDFSTFEGISNLMGFRHQVQFYDEAESNSLFIYAIGFEYNILRSIASLINKGSLINDNYYGE